MQEYKSRVYTQRPAYADFEPAAKFEAIKSIIARRLTEHPKAICSYSGGSDSDIMLDLIEETRRLFGLPPVAYAFFNTGLEMKATKDHVRQQAERYGVDIAEYRPKVGIVQAVRKCGIPFMSKIVSEGLEIWQHKNIPLSIADEFRDSEDKKAKRTELKCRYPQNEKLINFLCSCDTRGVEQLNTQLVISSKRYLLEFLKEFPPDFRISSRCCDYCKKQVAHEIEKAFDMVILGERFAEGGVRASPGKKDCSHMCFSETTDGKFRLKPLYYVSDKDKAWYKERHGIRYSDAYEVYGLTRTGCCGCPISHKAVEDLERIRPYEPNVVKAAWNIFGASYLYRQKYNEYKAERDRIKKEVDGQITLDELSMDSVECGE